MLYSSLTKFLNQVSNSEVPTRYWAGEQPLHFFAKQIMNLTTFLPLKNCRESQNKTTANSLILWILESLKPSIWIAEEKEKNYCTGDNRQVLLAERTEVVTKAIILFSFYFFFIWPFS